MLLQSLACSVVEHEHSTGVNALSPTVSCVIVIFAMGIIMSDNITCLVGSTSKFDTALNVVRKERLFFRHCIVI